MQFCDFNTCKFCFSYILLSLLNATKLLITKHESMQIFSRSFFAKLNLQLKLNLSGRGRLLALSKGPSELENTHGGTEEDLKGMNGTHCRSIYSIHAFLDHESSMFCSPVGQTL